MPLILDVLLYKEDMISTTEQLTVNLSQHRVL